MRLSGDLFRVKSQWALAIKEYRIAQEIVLNTQSLDLLPRIHSGLAVCYIRIKRFAGALCVLEEILQTQALSSALDQTYCLKGIVLFQTGDFGAAHHAFRRALECHNKKNKSKCPGPILKMICRTEMKLQIRKTTSRDLKSLELLIRLNPLSNRFFEDFG